MFSLFSISAMACRSSNQDSILLPDGKIFSEADFCSYSQTNIDSGLMLTAIADGMGGTSFGELASRTALETLQHKMQPALDTGDFEQCLAMLENSLEAVQDAVQNVLFQLNASGGTTLSLLLFNDEKYAVVNIGDSPIYLINNGQVQQLSKEHTYAQQLRDEGTPEAQISKKDRHSLTQSVGSYGYSEYHMQQGEFNVGDIIVLASDGMCMTLPQRKLLKAFQNPEPLFTPKLYRKVSDNASAVIIIKY